MKQQRFQCVRRNSERDMRDEGATLYQFVSIRVHSWFQTTKTPRTSQGEALGVHGIFRER